MSRKPNMLLTCAAIALGVFAPFAFGQQTAKLSKLNPFIRPTTDPNTEVGAHLQAAINSVKSKANMNAMNANKNNDPQLQTFTYSVTSSRDGNVYSGQIVGKSPFSNPQGRTTVSTHLIPIVIVTNSVFAGVDPTTGLVVTAPGITVFDPTIPDDSCLSAPNDVPLKLVQQSPIFLPFDFNFGGTDIGTVQTTDAFQRGNFFQLISHGQNANGVTYQVVLNPVTTAAKIVVNIPAADGVAYPSAAFGGCPTGKEAIIDIAVYEPAIISLFTQLASQGVDPSTLPFFLLHNVVQCEGNQPGCATLNSGGCCIDCEIACDGKEPWLKARATVVGGATLQNPQPCFLHQVVDSVASPQQVNEIANKAILILFDQCLQERDISLAQTKCDLLRLALH
jgi:hypothetical protein